jgi:hypothetical protein
MNWDQQRPVKAAAERCQGWASTSPPQGLPAPSLSHTHRPPFSGAHGPAGSWVDFPIPQNSFCMRFAKNGLAGSQPPKVARARASQATSGAGQAPCGRGACQPLSQWLLLRPRRCSARSFLIYPPTAVQRGARAGGLLGGFPNSAKLTLYAFCEKWARRLAAPVRARGGGIGP